MAEDTQVWNIPEGKWQQICDHARSQPDVLENGAYVRYATETDDLAFYATPFCKPAGWHYPFLEPIPATRQKGALIGRAWHDISTGFVQFEVILYAAAQALRADYESDVSDLDYVTYEQAVEQAVRGTEADQIWLQAEFGRLVRLLSQHYQH